VCRQVSIRSKLYKPTVVCAFALVLFAAASVTAAQKTYLDWIDDALAAIETGRNPDAVQSLSQALALNENDPLAHCALGFALLTGGRPLAEAGSEFAAAAQLDTTCAEAAYGLGLVALAKADIAEAARLFIQAQQARPDLNMAGTIGYVKYLAGGISDLPAENSYDEALQALHALTQMQHGCYSDAESIWQSLQEKAWRTGCGERFGCSMTFDKSRPLALTGSPIKRAYRSQAPARAKLPTVSGNVNLKADLSRAREVRMVSFFVDGAFVGMSNTPPFSYVWNTRKTPNGVHTVRIEGSDAAGTVVSSKSMKVVVANKGDGLPSARVAGRRADELWRRLWACMSVKASAANVNYNVALCASHRGDREAEKAALERVLAADPDHEEAAGRLSALYGHAARTGPIYGGSKARKVIALTFDDGPKSDTARILDILKQKGVKATFFLVGAQAQTYPDIVKRIAAEGHQVGSHTYNHRDLEYLTESQITQELFKTAATLRALTGQEVRYLRPPGGHVGKKLPTVARRFHLTTVLWSANCAPYEGKSRQKLFDYVVSSAKPGGIVLLHNLELVTLNALPDIIDALRRKGYEFVTVSELPN